MTFFDNYLNELKEIYKLRYNKFELTEEDNIKILNYFNKIVEDNYKPLTVNISNTTVQEINQPCKKVDFIDMYDKCRKENAVFSLSHGVYKRDKSQVIEIWDEQIIRRNEFKIKMKDSLKVLDLKYASLYDRYQKVFKEVANALYGGFGEENFVFYDINNISNLTGTCFYTLLTTINQIEKVLGNRLILRNNQELIDYVNYLFNKDIKGINEENDLAKTILRNENYDDDIIFIYNTLKGYCRYELDEEFFDSLFDKIKSKLKVSEPFRLSLFKYNCNFVKMNSDTSLFLFMINNDKENYFSNSFSEKVFSSNNKDIKTILDKLVYDDFLQSNLLDLCDNYKRTTVMLSDTDSTFCVSNKIFNSIFESVKDIMNTNLIEYESDFDIKTHTFKMIMFIGETMSDFFLKTLGGYKYQDSKDIRWKLKSEFLYHRILLLKVKKTYFGSILSQEGIRLSPMKLDNKNTELIRSIYNDLTKDFLKEVFNSIAMSTEGEVDIYKIIDLLHEHTDKFNEITKDYKLCSKLGTKANFKIDKAYKRPLDVWQYKAVVTFNALFPEYKTLPGDKVSILPIKVMQKFSFNHNTEKNNILSLNLFSGEILEKFNKNFKNEFIDTNKFILFLEEENLNEVLNNKMVIKSIIEPFNTELEKEKVRWFIHSYGVNEELKQRFENFFYKTNKSKFEKELYNTLLKNMSIGYLGFSFYSTMPECMIDLVDCNKLRTESIDGRVSRILEALRLKVYHKTTNSKKKVYLTNIIVL